MRWCAQLVCRSYILDNTCCNTALIAFNRLNTRGTVGGGGGGGGGGEGGAGVCVGAAHLFVILTVLQ